MKPKLHITTTVARTLFFFSGQPRLWKEAFDVTAIAAEQDKLERFAGEEGIAHKFMPMHREISLFSDFACLLWFIWIFLKERPQVVHGNTPKASMLSMVAAWITRRPIRIYMCHGLRYQTTTGMLRKVLMSMEKLSCSCATHVIGVSAGVCKQLVADGLCKEGKAKVIGFGTAGGIDVEKFSVESIKGMTSVREQLNIPVEDFVFCFVGRIVKDKGINELVTAFDRLSQERDDIHLLLIGPEEKDLDPISEESEKLIVANKHIYALGPQNNVRPWLAASNAFVLPSYREGVGIVLLEANAMGVPCIASDIIGCNDVVVKGVNGELIPARNADALHDKMKEWLEHPEKVAKMAAVCREHVVTHYEQSHVRNSAFEYYKGLLIH